MNEKTLSLFHISLVAMWQYHGHHKDDEKVITAVVHTVIHENQTSASNVLCFHCHGSRFSKPELIIVLCLGKAAFVVQELKDF